MHANLQKKLKNKAAC